MRDAAGTIVQAVERAQRTIGNKLHVAAGRNVSETIRVRFLSEPALGIAANVRVEGKFKVTTDVALKKEAPGLFRIAGKAERAEGNFEPDHKTLWRDPTL